MGDQVDSGVKLVAQYTPGPWTVEEPMDHELWIVQDGKEAYDWKVIAGCPFPGDRGDIPRKQVEANARLIAAAPDLLEALEAVVSRVKNSALLDVHAPEVTAAIAAIRKARGEA